MSTDARADGRVRVLLVSTSYPRDLSDWRGLFVRHKVYALAKIEGLHLSLWAPPGERPADVDDVSTPIERLWLSSLMLAGGISHLMRHAGLSRITAPITLLRSLSALYRRQSAVDIYHINWLQCAIPLPSNCVPALITVLGNDLKLLQLPLVRTLLRRSMRNRAVTICPNAEWMRGPLQEAFGDVATIEPVSFGIDPVWYAVSRHPTFNPPRWLAVTRLTRNKLGNLFEWSEPLFHQQPRELHLFGPMQEDITVPPWVQYHGTTTPDDLSSNWFPSACGLITLSQHAEGRPQVMLEAMAAGLPIVASRTNAHAAVVADGDTGILCDSKSSYASALYAVEAQPFNRALGEASRAKAISEFGTWESCASRYFAVYEQLMDSIRPI